jgi:hypothetical protein
MTKNKQKSTPDNWEGTSKQKKYWKSLKGVKNEKAPNWKENPTHITTFHVWLRANYGQPKKCDNPNCQWKF